MTKEQTSGVLYIVGTPIGNLEDMSFRAVRILKSVDWIAAEDTRNTIKLLNHFGIHTKMVSYHKYNEQIVAAELVERLLAGASIAQVSDAGMPVISDPGQILIAACHAAGVPVRVVPGPTAALSAVALSGMDCRHFVFMGFLGKQSRDLQAGLEAIAASTMPVVLYESPHRLCKTLEKMAALFPERAMSISREMTKQYEETLQGTVAEMRDHFAAHPPKGEFVLIVGGGDGPAGEAAALNDGPLVAHMAHYQNQGMSEKQAMKAVAKDRGVSKRDIYEQIKIAPEKEQ
jgi:16S rRNA (cytidine1402-2'-O)-methyltransferase